jgi:hypothetical protein
MKGILMRIFLVAAVVLVVFAIIASAAHTGLLFGTLASTWFFASFLAFLTDLLVGGLNFAGGKVTRTTRSG